MLGTVVAVGMLIEQVVIVVQVVRGRQSHFNIATPLDSTLYGLMGATVSFVWLATAGIAVLLLRERIADRSAALAVRAGLFITLIGMIVGFLMTMPSDSQRAHIEAGGAPTILGAHSVGVPDGGPGLPLVNWSTTGGDLRIGHFVGMHALQALPLLALVLTLASRRVRRLRGEQVRTRLVTVAASSYLGLTALVTWQALRGQPLIAPDTLTTVAAGALLLATAAGLPWALAARSTTPADDPAQEATVTAVA